MYLCFWFNCINKFNCVCLFAIVLFTISLITNMVDTQGPDNYFVQNASFCLSKISVYHSIAASAPWDGSTSISYYWYLSLSLSYQSTLTVTVTDCDCSWLEYQRLLDDLSSPRCFNITIEHAANTGHAEEYIIIVTRFYFPIGQWPCRPTIVAQRHKAPTADSPSEYAGQMWNFNSNTTMSTICWSKCVIKK